MGYSPTAATTLTQYRTTALSDAGYELLNAALTPDPKQRVSANKARSAAESSAA